MGVIGLDSVVTRSSGQVETRMGDQTVMMNIDRGRYYALEESGQRIWELISEPTRVGAIVDRLTEEYDVSRDRCESEVLGFLESLKEQGLLAEEPG